VAWSVRVEEGLLGGGIAGLSPRGTVELERYRPNIVIRAVAPGFAENDWVGRDLRIGSELIIRVVSRTPRCAIPTLEHGDLPPDRAALRVLAGHNRIKPIAAVVLGIRARQQIRETGQRGEGLAVAGLVLGWTALIFFFAAILGIMIWLALPPAPGTGGPIRIR
jgi:hypothetical protein